MMMGIGSPDSGTMKVRFFTKGVVTGRSTSTQRRDAFGGGESEFNGTADIEVTKNIFGTRTIKYKNGRANLISPGGTNVLTVKFTGTEKKIAPNVDQFDLEGELTGGQGLFNGLTSKGHFECKGAFYRDTDEAGLGFSIEYS